MSHPETCPHCHHDALVRPPRWRYAALALAWVYVVVLLSLAAMIGPFLMFAIPVVFAFGAGAVTAAHDLAFAAAECRRCGKIADDAAPEFAERSRVAAGGGERHSPLAAG